MRSNPGNDTICGLSLLLVFSFAPRSFSPGTPVFPSPQKPTFSNSNSTRNQVPNIIYLFISTYICLLSVLTFRSILTFPWVELGGKVNITCAKTGYNASITFHTKPFYGGKLHRVTGEVKNTSTGRVICKVNGEWNGKIEISFTSHQVCVYLKLLFSN